MLLIVYTAAILLSAALLFMVQPMAARLVLPRLGGSPAVWNTCMLFFQAVLLLGYGYAHLITRWKKLPGQVAVHTLILAAGLLALPISIRAGWTAPGPQQSASLWLLALLGLSVGLPFFVASTTGPLLQRWFAGTAHKDAHDPYFLYAASNIGSLTALLAYPLLLEPWLRLSTPGASMLPPRLLPLSQSTLWALGYAAFAALAIACGVAAIRRARAADHSAPAQTDSRAAPITLPARLRWIALAFIPSSLMLGVTQYLSTDIASIPLLWIVPLTIYLITFIAAFSRRGAFIIDPARIALGILAVAIAATFRMSDKAALWMLLLLHPAVLLAAGLAWHGRLARQRPAASHLTEYYFWIALGGVLGGVFNALIAPAIFKAVYEYPIILSLACLLTLWPRSIGWKPRQTGLFAAGMDLVAPAMLAAAMVAGDLWLARHPDADPTLKAAMQVWTPAVLALAFMFRPARGALAVAAIFAVALARPGIAEPVLHASRTFFGVYRVTEIPATPVTIGDAAGTRTVAVLPRRLFQHGTTTHGTQFIDRALARVATSYYHRSGPIGQVFQAYDGSPRLKDVAVIGLGAGTLAAYTPPEGVMTFYEIDPEVIRIATTPALFTFINDARADRRARIDCIAGDGRLQIALEPDGRFGLIVLDAFSSDSIPVHLMTREAMEIYLRKLAPGGVIAVHISNHYLNLRPVLEAIAMDLRLTGLIGDESAITSLQQVLEDKRVSTWVVLARDRADLAPLIGGAAWTNLFSRDPNELAPFLWTDDFSNILRILAAR
ncbi:MAG: fused MFS/spermidine synthase [Phycisphaerales bacterium]|nr:fused MFS/spermidine synthase [Phycisphaerales bacterium]